MRVHTRTDLRRCKFTNVHTSCMFLSPPCLGALMLFYLKERLCRYRYCLCEVHRVWWTLQGELCLCELNSIAYTSLYRFISLEKTSRKDFFLSFSPNDLSLLLENASLSIVLPPLVILHVITGLVCANWSVEASQKQAIYPGYSPGVCRAHDC